MIKDYFLLLLDWLRMTVVLKSRRLAPTFNEGDIWWCSVGINIGSEIFGKGKNFSRPVIVFKKIGKDSFLGIPLTKQLKDGSWYVPMHYGGIECRAILSRSRFSTKSD